MKQNKSILHLCEVILGVLMLILILNLYLVKLLVDPDISYTPMYRNLCLTLALAPTCAFAADADTEPVEDGVSTSGVTDVTDRKSVV